MLGLEDIFYQIAKGITRAYIDALVEAQHVMPEKPTSEDYARRDAFRAAVASRMRTAPHDYVAHDSPSGGN